MHSLDHKLFSVRTLFRSKGNSSAPEENAYITPSVLSAAAWKKSVRHGKLCKKCYPELEDMLTCNPNDPAIIIRTQILVVGWFGKLSLASSQKADVTFRSTGSSSTNLLPLWIIIIAEIVAASIDAPLFHKANVSKLKCSFSYDVVPNDGE